MQAVISYTIGFLLSVVLTFVAYIIVSGHFVPDWAAPIVLALAVVQMVVQLLFFLHLGANEKPRWNLAVFGVMLTTLLIVVIGSLWIMYNLNYNMTMTPEQITEYMNEQNQKGF